MTAETPNDADRLERLREPLPRWAARLLDARDARIAELEQEVARARQAGMQECQLLATNIRGLGN